MVMEKILPPFSINNMAEWSHLPKELIHKISTHLETSFDILRFRSVCATWRSSITPSPNPHNSNRFPILPHDGISSTSSTLGFYLSKRTIYHLTPINQSNYKNTPNNSNGWIIKLEQDTPNKPKHLIYPLSGLQFSPLPSNFPKLFNLFKIRVYELCQEYVLQYISYHPFANSLSDAGNLYMEKVVFNPNFNHNYNNGFSLLTIHISGRLAIFRSGENKWRVIDDMLSPYDDVAIYDWRFCAVDSTGRTVNVDVENGKVEDVVVESFVFDGDKKYLVSSRGKGRGRLLLVDKHLSLDCEEGNDNGMGQLFSERIVKFKVYELDEKEKKWVEVESLGDEVLFLGENSTFSASASELCGCKGNCIYFTNSIHACKEDEGLWYGTGVFDLESGSIGAFSDFSGLFWPPPPWITSTMMGVQNQLEDLSL